MLNVDDETSDFDFWLPLVFECADIGYAEWIMDISDAFWPPSADEEPPPATETAEAELSRAPVVQELSRTQGSSSRLARYGPDFISIEEFDNDEDMGENGEISDHSEYSERDDNQMDEDDDTDVDEDE